MYFCWRYLTPPPKKTSRSSPDILFRGDIQLLEGWFAWNYVLFLHFLTIFLIIISKWHLLITPAHTLHFLLHSNSVAIILHLFPTCMLPLFSATCPLHMVNKTVQHFCQEEALLLDHFLSCLKEHYWAQFWIARWREKTLKGRQAGKFQTLAVIFWNLSWECSYKGGWERCNAGEKDEI